MKKQTTNKEIRTWALVFALLLAIIATIQLLVWHHGNGARIFYILAGVFFVPGLLFPVLLRPAYQVWMKFAAALARFNTRLILSVVYFLVFAPIGLILRLFRVDLIKEKFDKSAETYWIRRPQTPFDPSTYERQF
ncbi:MAG: SxtJ family membrane protein [bacterium]|nr:SxtJ family membrane protein [bacterium]